MNKVVFAGIAAALMGVVLAPMSNACDSVKSSSFTISTPLSCDPCSSVSHPVLIERELTAPVLIDNTYSLPAVIERSTTMPVLIEDRDHLVDFSSPILRFGLF